MARYTETDALRRRLNIYAAVSFLLLLVCGALALALPLRERGKQVAQQLLTTTVVSRAQAVETWMRHAQAVAWHVALRPDIRALFPPAKPMPAQAKAILAASMGTTGDTAGLALVTPQGAVIAACGLAIPEDLLQKSLNSGEEVYISPPAMVAGQETVLIAVPVTFPPASLTASQAYSPAPALPVAEKGAQTSPMPEHMRKYSEGNSVGPSEGRVLLLRNMQYLHKIFDEDSKKLPATHYYLRMHEGIFFGQTAPSGQASIQSNSSQSAQSADASVPIAPPTENTALQQALAHAANGENGIIFQYDIAYAYTQLPYWHWELVGVVPLAQLYATWNAGFWYIIWGTLMVYTACFTGFYLLSRPLAGRILLRTHELEKDIRERRAAQQQLEQAHRLLQESYAQHRELSGQILTQLEQMRQKIATELHDNTGQQLTTLLLGLEVAQRQVKQGHINQRRMSTLLQVAAAQVQGIQRDLRRTAHGLYPPALELAGLAGSIEHLCHDVSHEGLNVHCALGALPPVDKLLSLTLYRITQEALNNILRHAKASEVHVALNCRQGNLVLTIEDNGQGFVPKNTFAPTAGSAHLGLRLMRERAQYCGGALTIESAPEQGTLLLVELPLKPTYTN